MVKSQTDNTTYYIHLNINIVQFLISILTILKYILMFQTLITISLLLLALPPAHTADHLINSEYTFQQFQTQFGRTYQGQERQDHRKAFYKNYQELLTFKDMQGVDYQLHVNNFTDFTDQEKKNLLNYRPTKLAMPYDQLPPHNKLRAFALPQSLNYTAQGKVTSVKDQGKCGSCWAFTTTAMYESQLLLKGMGEFDLAEQYVLECTSEGSCNGGWPNNALQMFADKGLPLENTYPYKGQSLAYEGQQICSSQQLIKLPYKVETLKHYNQVPDQELKQILLDNGPVSVGVKAFDTGFLYYANGVFSGCETNTAESQVDHVLLLVGWTKQGNWIVKNSWGKSWGQKGYAIINKTRNCGLTHFVDVLSMSKVKIDVKNPDTQKDLQNQSEILKVKMIDTYGDGWNGYVLGVRQHNSIVTVFGEEFQSGSKQDPVDIEIKSGVQTEIVVVVVGQNSQQIGFQISDSQGQNLCARQPGLEFASSIIFCSFCPNCQSDDRVAYQLTLFDARKDGWNGNVLQFKQNGQAITFGEQFMSGKKYGPRKVQFTKNVPVQIWPFSIGSRPEDIGFEIRDQFGNIAYKRVPGTSFTPEIKVGQFCPGCQNLFQVNYAVASGPARTSYPAEGADHPSLGPFIAAISVLSVLVIILSVALGISIRRTKKFTELVQRKQSFPGSILVSTATIPDEIQQPGKQASSTQQIKLN